MTTSTSTQRPIAGLLPARATSDGAGVKIRRSLGQTQQARLDPFLMLDEFFSDNPADYLAGFPSHPHRGFETVTYMLDGHMLHEDHLGNRGDLRSGDVQWMTAGRGIIHSEMPQQKQGRMRGFQLWINLPAAEKMKPAGYRDIKAADIPVLDWHTGVKVKLIAGTLASGAEKHAGAVTGGATEPLYAHLTLEPGAQAELPVSASHQAFVYAIEGEAHIGSRAVPAHTAAILGDGDRLTLQAGQQGAELLLLAGKPLREPVVQYGPFVMNTAEEIEQALRDYRDGRLTAA